jgi:prepilin-type N-terminal cleavage/methylation domain-containing protein
VAVRRNRGFTLIEVIAAVMVGAVILIGARELFIELDGAAQRIVVGSHAVDRDANAERLLRALTVRLEVGIDSTRRFGGDEREAHFTSWCDVPSGWQERCDVTIRFDTLNGRMRLLLVRDTLSPIPVVTGLSGGRLRYLSSAVDGGVWFRTWSVGRTAPLAIGVLCDRAAQGDTLVLRIGTRG